MLINVSSIKTILTCPRKFWIDNHQTGTKDCAEEDVTRTILRYGGSTKSAKLCTGVFGIKLCSCGLELFSDSKNIKLISHRRGKKLYTYHYYEAALHGYIYNTEANSTGKKLRIIFKSPHYEIELSWQLYLDKALNLMSEISKMDEPFPVLNHECRFCIYAEECKAILVKKGELSVLRGLGKNAIEKLHSNGIEKLSDIIERKGLLKELVGETRGEKIYLLAKAFMQEKIYQIKPIPDLPDGIFLDIESYPPKQFHYLFGVLLKNKYIPFMATTPDNEKKTFLKLIKFLEKNEGPIYHYHTYEPNQIKSLLKKFKMNSNITRRFVDIYEIVSQHLAIPTISYSLKSLAKYFGFHWRTDLNGMKVVTKFEEFLKTKNKKIIEEILTYNEDDVRATKLLWEVLKSKRERRISSKED
ncbi:TM0106 family RecB-like putative nuclease [Thermosipho ferrireducens]|uniref:TM0106 family RecB-like putative nuclease n=1 Tax=Thermosipho ferrireducens TaxID=2571116 RepID=A0ABX7S9U4_9BACT|nr:TM0106 family RecB-like putative nuclease [Thermosipho ferrireducens]QTA38650.1 TM0106 family RecB-like putative nuclease [Thermosipho ferrireducens]